MDKEKKLLSRKLAKIRGWIQAAATLLTNIHIPNLFKGKIYQGNAKTVCVPGLNCYSCPAATGACPIGAFQAVVGSSKFKFSYYITGFFILLGVTLGRFICGFLCPFGWFQDLLHKIPGKKLSTAKLKPLKICHTYCFRYTSSDACNELYRNGRPVLLQIYLSSGCFRGCYTVIYWKCCYPFCAGKAFFFQVYDFNCSDCTKYLILQALL